MEDIIKSIKATLYERVGNPLLFSFLIAWCLHNYRVIMIILSSEPLNTKLVGIDAHFQSNFLIGGSIVNYGCILHALIVPLIYSLIYIYIVPLFSKPINRFHYKKQKELLTAKHDAEGEELLTKEQSRELRKKIVLLEKEYKTKIDELENENSELKQIIDEVSGEKETEEPLAKMIALEPNEIEVLKSFKGASQKSVNTVSNEVGIKLDLVLFYCDKLLTRRYLQAISRTNDQHATYELSHEGRAYLYANGYL